MSNTKYVWDLISSKLQANVIKDWDNTYICESVIGTPLTEGKWAITKIDIDWNITYPVDNITYMPIYAFKFLPRDISSLTFLYTKDITAPSNPIWKVWVLLKNTVYTWRKIELTWVSAINPTDFTLTSQVWWDISNIVINWLEITFDYTTWNFVWDTLDIQGKTVTWVSFNLSIDTPGLS